MADTFWLDRDFRNFSPQSGWPELKFKTLYPKSFIGNGFQAIAGSLVGLISMLVVLTFIGGAIQLATEEIPATATVVQCIYTPFVGKSSASLNFTLQYALGGSNGRLTQGSTELVGTYLNSRSCNEYLPGTPLKIKYDPNQPSHVDIIEDSLLRPFLEDATLYGMISMVTASCLYYAFTGWRGITLFFVKSHQYLLLQQKGELRDGEIVFCTGKLVGKNPRSLLVTVRYKFWTPQGTEQYGKQIARRNDLSKNSLPPPGTPINVLYVNDHVHCVL